MASNRIQGITIEIGGDVTGLNKALSSTNKEIKSTQAQLKDVERLLKLDPTNTELLEQKQRLLSKAVEETRNKLDTLKEAEKQAQQQFEEGKISQEQYDALKREIVATEQELKSLESQASKSNATLAKVAATADKVADATQRAANATKGMSLAAGGALVALGGMAVSAGQSADDINTLSKQTGLATSTIQKFQYASDIIDVSLETLTGSMAKLTRNMANAQKGTGDAKIAFEQLGVSIVDANGDLRNNEDVFNDVIAALAAMENETQRDAYAMQIFGRSAQDLNPLILGGAEALWELGDAAEEAGLILSQEALDAANEFNDAIDLLKATAKGTFQEVGTEIATMLIPFMEKLSTVIGAVLEWFRDLDEEQLKTIGTILLVVASISPLLSVISKVSKAISFISSTVIPALNAAFAFLAANPIVLVIAAVVALIAAIALFGDKIQEYLGKVNEFVQGIFAKDWSESFGVLGEVLNGFFANVKIIWDSIMQIFNGIIDFIRGVFTGDWERVWEGVKSIFGGIFDALVGIAKVPLNGIITLLNMAIEGINFLLRGLNKIQFDAPDWVPGIGGKTFGINIPEIQKIAYLAKGGDLSAGNAIVGENGPELLSILSNGNARVTPLNGGSGGSGTVAGTSIVINEFHNHDTATDMARLMDFIDRGLASRQERVVRGSI